MRSFFVLMGLIGMMACGDRTIKSGVVDPYPPQYSRIRSLILMPRCSKCHSLVESRKLLLEKWVVPGDPDNSHLYGAVNAGTMPPYGNKLLDEEIEAIRLWINAGAPND
jgi:mono/diheme cytochrome c family protein